MADNKLKRSDRDLGGSRRWAIGAITFATAFSPYLFTGWPAQAWSPAECQVAIEKEKAALRPFEQKLAELRGKWRTVKGGFDTSQLACVQSQVLYERQIVDARYQPRTEAACLPPHLRGKMGNDASYIPKFKATMDRDCAEAEKAATARNTPPRTGDCVSARTQTDKEGLHCLIISNGCGVSIDAYTAAQHKGKLVYRTYKVSPGRKENVCQASLQGSIQSYIGYCDTGDLECFRKAKRSRQ